MKPGDIITATWPDGLQVVGVYARTERGYVIILDGYTNREVPCNSHHVTFELGNNIHKPVEASTTTYRPRANVIWAIAGFILGLLVGGLM